MKETRKIEVVPYDPTWPTQFEAIASAIKNALGDECVAVHHVGSTSVPGLAAKPKIDLIVVVKSSPTKIIDKLESVGFEYRGEFNIPMRFFFRGRGSTHSNVHVFQEGHPEIELNLAFRDYLRNHQDVCDQYARLKRDLLQKESSFEKNDSIFTGYNLGKDAFIRDVIRRTGYQRLRFVHCTHFEEWDAAKAMRQRYFFDNVPVSDPYQWTFYHPEHRHFILYRGVDIVGYAHIQLWPNARAAIRIIVVEEGYRRSGYGKQFMDWIEAWLSSQDYRSLHTEAAPGAVAFYRQLGYVDMPFGDPEGDKTDPRDTAMCKVLQF
jgi:GrpB-like predicted nucleotidyltransferase (UPF0157 family)/GNAT superfamily N-acetyltransferase